MGKLESLKALTSFGLLSDDLQNLFDELSTCHVSMRYGGVLTLGVVTLGPVVTSTALSEDEVVWAMKFAKRTSTDGIHGTRLEVD